MGAREAGKIDREWLEGARQNESPESGIVEWFRTVTNRPDLGIDDEGHVWSAQSYLTQEEIDEYCERIDRGV